MRSGEDSIKAGIVRDGLFLSGIVALAAIPYLTGLGFYSDDYAFLATMTSAKPQSWWAVFQSLMMSPNLAVRPVQAAYLATLYMAFGLSALPGHVINLVIFAIGLLFFYGSLRRLGLPRFYCVALPLVFACLPHFSTDRFWFATYQITLSMSLFFVTFYCSLRFVEGSDFKRWIWLLLTSITMLTSLMAYETFMPLFLLIPCIAWLPRIFSFNPNPRPHLRGKLWQKPFLAHFLTFFVIILSVALLKLQIHGEHRLWQGNLEEWIGAMSWLIKGVLKTTFLEQGLKLPINVATLLLDHWRPEAVLIALTTFAAILSYLISLERSSLKEWTFWEITALGGLGMLVFIGGYAVFTNNFRVGFSPTGIANRVAMASAVGTAMIALSFVLLMGRLLPERLSRPFVSFLISIGCSVGILINGTLGVLWVEATQAQRAVLTQLTSNLPELPGATTLLLDGICPFVGPGPVFESSLDLKGALQIHYGNPAISADVIKSNVQISDTGITTTLYDTLVEHYRYGRLLVYNAREDKTWLLEDHRAALDYFTRFNPATSAGCTFEDGGGVSVF
jgi:hypothetical protein